MASSANSPALTARRYIARGCVYELDQYEDGVILVSCWNRKGVKVWEGITNADDDTRVIDAVRDAKLNAEMLHW